MNRPVLPVELGGVLVALDALAVQEVLGQGQWQPLPGATSAVPGTVAWRGRAVAVVDLRQLLGLGGSLRPGEPARRIVIARAGRSTCALPVDGVGEAQEAQGFRATSFAGSRQPHTSGEVELAGTPIPVVDLVGLVDQLTRAVG